MGVRSSEEYYQYGSDAAVLFCLRILSCVYLNSKHGLSVIDKSKRLLIPFFTVGLLWMLPIRLLVRYQGYVGKSLWHIILIDIIMGKDNGHLWFLPTLMIIFLILIGVKKWVAIFKWPDWSFDLLSAFSCDFCSYHCEYIPGSGFNTVYWPALPQFYLFLYWLFLALP